MILEQACRLSRSRIWQWQRRYFSAQGAAAWQTGAVPHYVTSNAFIADAYAKMVLGFLRDCATTWDLDQPLYIVELGAGVGRFGFHFLSRLRKLLAGSPLSARRVCYVLTDFAEANVEYYRAHPRLMPFFSAGHCDCARFDLETDHTLTLRHSGEVLAPGGVRNPIVYIANYVFDSVPQDAFFVDDGRLHESLLSLTTESPVTDLDDPALFDLVEVEIEHRPLALPYYEDASWNQILAGYARPDRRGELLFPCAALSCLSRLRALASSRLLLLSGDKGCHALDDVYNQEPGWSVHGSCSLPVNFHAIAEWTRAQGGHSLQPGVRQSSLHLNAFAFGSTELVETRLAFANHLSDGGPTDLFLIKQFLETQYAALTLEQALALLRLTCWDSQIFIGLLKSLQRKLAAGEVTPSWRVELLSAVENVQEMYFPIGEAGRLDFDIARLIFELRQSLIQT